jgi:hypothetical protein
MTSPSLTATAVRSAAGLAALTMLSLATLTSTANAASYTAGDFSAYVSGNPTVANTVDNCTVELGPVVDTAYPNYRKIGGVRVNCGSVHSVVKATVWEQYYNGSAWVNWGYSGVGTRYNSAGSGYGINGILRSPGVCSPYPGYTVAWRTAALVQTENVGGYRYSNWASDNRGC